MKVLKKILAYLHRSVMDIFHINNDGDDDDGNNRGFGVQGIDMFY